MTNGGHGEEVFRSMLDQEYAAAAAKRNSLGLAPMIEKDIIRQQSRKSVKKTDQNGVNLAVVAGTTYMDKT